MHSIIGGTNTVTNNLEFYGKIIKFKNKFKSYKLQNYVWTEENKVFSRIEDSVYFLNPYKKYDIAKIYRETIFWDLTPNSNLFYITENKLIQMGLEINLYKPSRILFDANTPIITGFEYKNPENSINLYDSRTVVETLFWDNY